jgi:hypothetical protein
MKRLLVICVPVFAYILFTSVDNGLWIQDCDDDHPHDIPLFAVFSSHHEVGKLRPPLANSGRAYASLVYLDTIVLLM